MPQLRLFGGDSGRNSFWPKNLFKIDPSGSFNLLLNNQNNNKTIQSAGNCKGPSETIRQLSNNSIYFFFLRYAYLAYPCPPEGGGPMSTITTSIQSSLGLKGGDPKSQTPLVPSVNGSPLFLNSSPLNEVVPSETPIKEKFNSWLAGIIDGDGNFDLRKDPITKELKLKAIRIKLHNRDIRILTRIQNHLHCGRIRSDKNKPYSIYIVSTKEEMKSIMGRVNGLIRIKVDSFKKSCEYFGIKYIESDYIIKPLDPYFSGLIDTDGSIVFNYPSNRIECNLEFKYNNYTKKLNFDNVIPNYKPDVYLRKKKNQSLGREFKSIAFKYQTVNGMIPLYDYFMENRLYCDMKFYRVSKIKEFIKIRHFNKYPKESPEFQIYSSFLLNWIQYRNPLWNKVPFVNKIR